MKNKFNVGETLYCGGFFGNVVRVEVIAIREEKLRLNNKVKVGYFYLVYSDDPSLLENNFEIFERYLFRSKEKALRNKRKHKLLVFLKSKHKVYYDRGEVVPFYKGLWYDDLACNRYVCVISPLAYFLRIITAFYRAIKHLHWDVEHFYQNQVKLRQKRQKISSLINKGQNAIAPHGGDNFNFKKIYIKIFENGGR